MAASNADDDSSSVTRLLQEWGAGSAEARDRLFAMVYDELRRRAAAQLRRENPGHTLQPTALVHEAYLRLSRQDRAAWQNRSQFFAIASQVMRRVLVDHARARRSEKRAGTRLRVELNEALAADAPRDVDVLALDQALDELTTAAKRPAQVVELRYFGGLELDAVAETLGVSPATAKRDWRFARAWLLRRLSDPPLSLPGEG